MIVRRRVVIAKPGLDGHDRGVTRGPGKGGLRLYA
jgi:hypothetical protein